MLSFSKLPSLFALSVKMAIIATDMSDLQPENFPHTPEQMDDFLTDPDTMAQLIERRTAAVTQFFHTEIGAFSLLKRVAEAQEKMGDPAHVHNERGYWQYYRPIDYNPDKADSSQRRFLSIILHTNEWGTYPRLAVRTELEGEPVEYYQRSELLVAHFALKGQSIMLTEDGIAPMATLMGPETAEKKMLLDRQQRYAQWVSVAAHATGISPVKRSRLFITPRSFNAN